MNKETNYILLTLLKLKNIGPSFIWKNINNIKKGIDQKLEIDKILELCDKNIYDIEGIKDARIKAQNIIDICKNENIKIVNLFDDIFPDSNNVLKSKFSVLYVKGDFNHLKKRIGIIGTREASYVALKIADRLGQFIASKNIYIVNGIAKGIDMASIDEQMSLKNSLGVLPGGLAFEKFNTLNQDYKSNVEYILKNGGCLVSSFDPHKKQDQFTTVEYCKLQALLSDSLILVQSDIDGGSRYTVKSFAELERNLCVIDANAFDSNKKLYSANNLILKEGKNGITEWCGIKLEKVKCKVIPIRNKDDYPKIIETKQNDEELSLF